MKSVSLQNLGKRYPNMDSDAVKGVTLDVAAGEFLVVVGPSGCGKSTLLRMIAGLESITFGELYFGSVCVNNIPPKSRDIGMVFQNYALYPHLTVAENIGFSLRIRGDKKEAISNRTKEIASMLSLSGLLNRKPKELSGGQRQRVALGRAIAKKPSIFLFDEPLSNLDAQLRTQMRLEILSLQRQLGSTGVYVTHDQVEAMTMGDKIAVMHEGMLQQIGTPEEVYSLPTNLVVAKFIGSPQINIFKGAIYHESDYVFREDSGGIALTLPADIFKRNEPPASGSKVSLAVRPEHLSLGSEADKPYFLCAASGVENIGHEALVYFRSTDSEIKCCRFSSGGNIRLRAGEAIEITIDTDKCLLYDSNDMLL